MRTPHPPRDVLRNVCLLGTHAQCYRPVSVTTDHLLLSCVCCLVAVFCPTASMEEIHTTLSLKLMCTWLTPSVIYLALWTESGSGWKTLLLPLDQEADRVPHSCVPLCLFPSMAFQMGPTSGACGHHLNCSINCLCAGKQYLKGRSAEDATPLSAIIWKVAAN